MLHLVRGSPGTGWTWSLWWLCASFTVLRKLGSALGVTCNAYFIHTINLFYRSCKSLPHQPKNQFPRKPFQDLEHN